MCFDHLVGIERLEVNDISADGRGLPKLALLSASLQKLGLHSCVVPEISVVSALTSLLQLNLNSCKKLRVLPKCPTLQKLHISDCENLEDISALVECSSLCELHLGLCPHIEDISPLAECTSLRMLVISDCSGIKSMVGCTSLHHLAISWCAKLQDISALAECASLRCLLMSECRLEDISSLAKCSSLCTLSLVNYGNPVDISALKALPSLRQIEITLDDNTDTSLPVLAACMSLQRLSIHQKGSSWKWVTFDMSSPELTTGFSSLKELSISGFTKVTVVSSPSLEKVDLKACSNVTVIAKK